MNKKLLILAFSTVALFILMIAGLSFLTREQQADLQAVSAANRLVETGHLTEAIQIYEQLITQGVQDSAVHYNLGNAYTIQGDLGRAILNYQRAVQLDPRDEDIRVNLALARQKAQYQDQVPLDTVAPGPLHSLANLTGRWLTPNETAVLALGFWFLVGMMLLAGRILNRGALRSAVQYGAVLAMLVVIMTGLSLGSRVYVERTQPEGVVIAPVVALSSEPGEEYAMEISLHSGAEVNLVETQGAWARLAVPGDAVQGWIPLDSVETVGWLMGGAHL